jgi:hypothetical protein
LIAVKSSLLTILDEAEVVTSSAAATMLMVDEGAEVIEVYSEDRDGALLLATHLLNFEGPETRLAAIQLEGGQQLSFTINLARDANGVVTGAQVKVDYFEINSNNAVQRAWNALALTLRKPGSGSAFSWKPAAALATMVLLALGGWWLWSHQKSAHHEIVRLNPAPLAVPQPSPLPTTTPQLQGSHPETGSRLPGERPATAPSPQPAASPARPTPSEPDETTVARSIVPDAAADLSPESGDGRRGWDPELMGKPFGEVQSVFVEAVGPNVLRQRLDDELRRRLKTNSIVRFAEREQADAALKISVRPASKSKDEQRVIAIVRVVSANGYVMWPMSRRGSSWRYVGRADYVVGRILTDLESDLARARRHSR